MDINWWKREGYIDGRELKDGRWLIVTTLTYGRGRLILCNSNMDIMGFWGYDSVEAAVCSLEHGTKKGNRMDG